MFPQTKDTPSGFDQGVVGSSITFNVPTELRGPVPFVCSRMPTVLRANVPEAAIDEDRQLSRCENDVWPYSGVSIKVEPHVLAVPVPERMQRFAKCYFGFGVASAICTHVPRAAFVQWLRVIADGPRLLSGIDGWNFGHAFAASSRLAGLRPSWEKISHMMTSAKSATSVVKGGRL